MPKSPPISIKGKSYNDLHNLGARSYLAKDYAEAVLYFSKASELGVKKLGDQLHDEMADIYLLYGKSLLELARMEGDPFGENVPKEVVVGEEAEEEEDSSDDEDAEKVPGEKGDTDKGDVEKGDAEKGDAKKVSENETEKVADGEEKDEDEEEEDISGEEEDDDEENDEMDNSKNEQIEGIELNGEEINSTSENKENEGGSKSQEENGEEEEPSDLQLAWEILELAKIIYTKREDRGKKFLADTLITLGEISMESENVQAAMTDINEAIAVLGTLEDKNNRMLAEAYYKLGMAVAMENKLDEAIDYYNKSKEVLENRIKDLAGSERELHKAEVKDMQKVIPEIEEKVVDLRNFKEEQLKTLEESNSVVADDESDKKPNDISHLVKRKRKSEPEDASANPPPPKKPSLG
ncbi:protein HGV2 [Onthophagus taurus]|uniref:protein HGV2 n=1 Tax=Onthophagus taurus TaxID=166361 RepID=UPI000C20B8A5|nr:protein HGV2-like [Onthophagus taurus]XP_022906659.1 protein HGV2-like [Onthophagus taurus]